MILFGVYKVFKGFYTVVYYYYFPFIVLLISFLAPLYANNH